MNGAQWVVHALRAQGVNTVFGYPGGAIMPVYDALYDGGVEHLLCRHEQGAAMALSVMPVLPVKLAYVSPRLGPGATNLNNRACGRTVRFHPCVATPVKCPHRLSAPTHFRKWMSWDCR